MADQHGFTYLGLLFAIAFAGLMLAGTGEVWHLAAKREREEQLLFVGRAFARALASYREATPADRPPEWPQRLEDLVEDRRRGFEVRRHLRRLYADPVTGAADWGLVRAGKQIVAIHSLSAGKPLRRARFLPEEEGFAVAENYAKWVFSGQNAVGNKGDVTPPAKGMQAGSIAGADEAASRSGSPLPAAVPESNESTVAAACGRSVTLALTACSSLAVPGVPPDELNRCRMEAELRYAACLRGG